MVIRIYAINQMARGCKVTFDPGGSKSLHCLLRSIAPLGWTVHEMGWIDGTDLAVVFVEGANKAKLTEHLKADPEIDFSRYK